VSFPSGEPRLIRPIFWPSNRHNYPEIGLTPIKPMRFRNVAITLTLAANLAAAAETVAQPGQLAASFPPPGGTETAALIRPSNLSPIAADDRHDRTTKRIWMASIAAALAGSAADSATSWGKREGNGLLASGDGTFGGRAVGVKAGITAAVLVPQILLRNHTNLRKKFIIANFIEAGVFAGTAAHNATIAAPK
jgi:hypothetical protein